MSVWAQSLTIALGGFLRGFLGFGAALLIVPRFICDTNPREGIGNSVLD